ncbi:MAG: hypothetical protein BWK80_38920 [Desulfobacteraceae bacterium IS3]|nr:MAG: hypothetical protein BWK80_38920 [Desulfobacteraceae bacterium IS3]
MPHFVRNEGKHHVSFHEGATAFNDPDTATLDDPGYSTTEYNFTGFARGKHYRPIIYHISSEIRYNQFRFPIKKS